jgi:hypothetical protein
MASVSKAIRFQMTPLPMPSTRFLSSPRTYNSRPKPYVPSCKP